MFCLVWQTAELACAVPAIVAARLTLPPLRLTDPGRWEAERMVSEKVVAFHQAWMAMGLVASKALQIACKPTLPGPAWVEYASNTGLKLWAAGLAPVYQTAMANHRRLGARRTRH